MQSVNCTEIIAYIENGPIFDNLVKHRELEGYCNLTLSEVNFVITS